MLEFLSYERREHIDSTVDGDRRSFSDIYGCRTLGALANLVDAMEVETTHRLVV